jgi:hypothetical protein
MNANEQKPGQQNQSDQQNQGGGQGGQGGQQKPGQQEQKPGQGGQHSRVVRATKVDNAKAARVASKVSANVFRTLNYRPRSRPGVFLCIAEGGETAFPELRRARLVECPSRP